MLLPNTANAAAMLFLFGVDLLASKGDAKQCRAMQCIGLHMTHHTCEQWSCASATATYIVTELLVLMLMSW